MRQEQEDTVQLSDCFLQMLTLISIYNVRMHFLEVSKLIKFLWIIAGAPNIFSACFVVYNVLEYSQNVKLLNVGK